MFPDNITTNRKGFGCILFDTYMCTTNAANVALIKVGGCPTANYHWLGTTNGYYGIGFDFDKTGGGTTTMRAVADKCRNEGAEGRALDGDRVNPAGDNKEWIF